MKTKIVPYYMNGNPSSLFCILPRDDSSRFYPPGSTPVYLNVYDISTINSCISWTGIGAFHTGIEVHGVEYGFGCHQESESGVFEIAPKKCPGFKFRESILMGSCCRCILPVAIKGSAARNESNSQDYEKKSLRSSFGCFASFSSHNKSRRVSISSLCRHSLYKGCLPPWELEVDSQRLCDDEDE
ncbi:deSI-like protein [Tanacetum coccineum]